MSRILEVIRRVVREEMAARRGSLLGVVTSVFPHTDAGDDHNYEVDVRLKHEGLELRRVPIAVGHVGVAAPPRVSDLVLVHFIDGDLNQPVVAGRFYHADDRPPLHQEDEILFEQRVPDGTLNHLRFTADGSIVLQREVTKPEDNSEARSSIRIDGASGDIEIRAGTAIVVTLTHGDRIAILADGKPVEVTCSQLTVNGDTTVNGDLVVSGNGQSTTISGNTIQGG